MRFIADFHVMNKFDVKVAMIIKWKSEDILRLVSLDYILSH